MTNWRITWRKQKSERGLARIVQGPRGYDLFRGGVARGYHVALRKDLTSWYWYGGGQNTYARALTFEQAKAEAKAYFLRGMDAEENKS